MKKKITLIVFLLLPIAWSTASADTRIILNSDPGDYIGGGNTYDFSGPFSISINNSSISIFNDEGWSFEFVSPDNRELEKGAYLNAERAPFRGPLNPGLSVNSPGRGCNEIAGEFFIHEISIDDTSPVLALDFAQRCEGGMAELNGSIRVDSSLAQPYTNPVAADNAPAVVYEGEVVELDGSASFSGTTAIIAYQWEHIAGPGVSFGNATANQTTLQIVDDVQLGGETLTLSLTVTDANSLSDTVEFTVAVASKSDPRSYFTMDSESDDYIGQGRAWSYDSGNSVITARRNFNNGVSVNIESGDFWSADFVAADDVQLETGIYDSAMRYPFQDSGVPGINISGDGRGCNEQFGNFTVEQLVWDDEQPISFKASFEQRCESLSAPRLTGEVAFNSLHISVPTANAGADFTVSEGTVANLNGSDSFDAVGSSIMYAWSTTEASVVINNDNQSRANFIAPFLENRESRRDIVLELYIVDDEGYAARDSVTVSITADNSRPNAIDDSVAIGKGEELILEPLLNDYDLDGQLLIDSIVIVQAPAGGSVVINSDGTLRYTHSSTNSDTDSFTYSVQDNDGAVSNVATVTISVMADTSGDNTPSEETPGEETPGEETPGEETPGEETPGEETPGEETQGEDTSGDDGVSSSSSSSGSLDTFTLLVLGAFAVLCGWRKRVQL